MRIPALVLVGVVSVGVFTGSTRAQQRPAVPVSPSDVKGVLFELANSMGMLRGMQQEDSILTLEHWLKGTMTVGTQRFDVPEYRMSINYSVPGMRADFRRQTPGGQALRMIEVLSGAAAWNETDRGKNPAPVSCQPPLRRIRPAGSPGAVDRNGGRPRSRPDRLF